MLDRVTFAAIFHGEPHGVRSLKELLEGIAICHGLPIRKAFSTGCRDGYEGGQERTLAATVSPQQLCVLDSSSNAHGIALLGER